MKIVGANSYRDGGTVVVHVEDRAVVTVFQLDYSLPWDGRPRVITMRKDGKERRVELGSEEEEWICNSIRGCLENVYGADVVCRALETSAARRGAEENHRASQNGLLINYDDYKNPYPVPFEGMWLFVFDFVDKACREGKIHSSQE